MSADDAGANQPPEPPYYAVIFSNRRTAEDDGGYAQMAQRMVELAAQQPGFLGIDSARSPDGFGITVSYWKTEADVAAWRAHAEHLEAQRSGRDRWYASYDLRVAKVERAYSFERE